MIFLDGIVADQLALIVAQIINRQTRHCGREEHSEDSSVPGN
jgi:hypothetical protein